MGTSILTDVKKMLGIDASHTHFDPEIILHINSVLMVLQQIGVGPESGFSIKDENNTWEELLGDRKDIESVKTYVYLKVRLLFDPPSSSYVLDSFERQIKELEWRLNIQVDKVEIPDHTEEGGELDGE